MDPAVARALDLTRASSTRERTIDITTTGRRTGRPRRIEIFHYRVAGRTYLCSGTVPSPSWYVNLVAHPDLIVHLKHGVHADLRARARPVTEPDERLAVIGAIVDDLNQPANPGHLPQPQRVADWLGSRLVELTFEG